MVDGFMKIATILFTYNRSYHAGKVLEALRNSEVFPEKLFIFQDGLKKEEHRQEWEKVKKLIHNVEWCETEVVESEINKGLAVAIVSGLDRVFKDYDAVIVLEDDCVPHKKFMTFMTESLSKYEYNNKVYGISGYTNPVKVPSNGTDAYFTRRAESLGWGTWKDRWSEYAIDYRMAYRIKNHPDLRDQYYIWGADLESYLHGNIEGKCNSWAVFWSLLVIEKEGYCLAPYESLVENIGFDGTGVHSGITPIKQILRDPNNLKDFIFPAKVELPENYQEIFKSFFATVSREEKLDVYNNILNRWVRVGDTHMLEYVTKQKSVAIWGTGPICDLLIEKLCHKVDIDYIIKSNTRENEKYRGIPVVEIGSKDLVTDLVIVIPIYDLENIIYQHPDIERFSYIGLDELIG